VQFAASISGGLVMSAGSTVEALSLHTLSRWKMRWKNDSPIEVALMASLWLRGRSRSTRETTPRSRNERMPQSSVIGSGTPDAQSPSYSNFDTKRRSHHALPNWLAARRPVDRTGHPVPYFPLIPY
jgi:hypothetical protein